MFVACLDVGRECLRRKPALDAVRRRRGGTAACGSWLFALVHWMQSDCSACDETVI